MYDVCIIENRVLVYNLLGFGKFEFFHEHCNILTIRKSSVILKVVRDLKALFKPPPPLLADMSSNKVFNDPLAYLLISC